VGHQEAVAYARANGLFQQLEAIYDQVPKCRGCIGCKSCCSESVNATYIEFLYVIDRCFPDYEDLLSLPEKLRKHLLKFSIFELAIPQKCPFLDGEGRCIIYDARPLACRVYGTLRREDYENNFRAIVKQNMLLGQSMAKSFGVKPHPALLLRKIPFCEHVSVTAPVMETMMLDWQNQLVNLDGKLYFESLMTMLRLNGNLIGHFMTEDKVLTKLPDDLLTTLRISVLKALQSTEGDFLS
jgi:Fe-S-cluster containining protein